MWFLIFLSITLLVCSDHRRCNARDTITAASPLADRETLVSAGKIFELGFFLPEGNNGRKYVGIWYKRDPQTVVWVANRDMPLQDSTGAVVAIAKDGNLNVSNGMGTTYFSTELQSSTTFNRSARLLDSGNLVFIDSQSGKELWQSFNNPTDTFLPGMVMNDQLKLIAWATPSNPGTGNYTFQQDPDNDKFYTITKKTSIYWRSGEPGIFITSNKMPSQISNLLKNNRSLNPGESSPHKKLLPVHDNRLRLNSSGCLEFYMRDDLIWSEPHDNCSVYNFCGNFGSCSSKNEPPCKCFPGFEPYSLDRWNAREFSSGCKRESDPCSNSKQQDKFLNVTLMKAGKPDIQAAQAKDEAACRASCLEDCHCQAYSFIEDTERDENNSEGACWIWTSDLKDLQENYTNEGKDLSIRVAAPNIVSAESNPRNPFPYVHITDERQTTDFIDEEDSKGTNVSFFKLESILAATENFSDANKLGEGGFGPVYRGTFFGGQDIAVKRLSSHSGQGMEEFRNEVVLIAKLQHRNLVRLLGYCVEGNEKILLYEYMPNKSLDAFIFDEKLCILLDWKKRFDIILGIARGLLYLHQDSRLRIIHRDLKTSNILLDEEMNPKVSDFGLARIVEGKQTEVNTNRVVGTYGYMSPEYALEGLFSVKSDVFSFGVIVLEIVSGKRTTGSYQSKEALNLLGYAWRLWKEEKALDLLDHTLLESCNKSEVLKCINIGLLCVQEDPNDRPTMSNVVFMLGSESATIPSPNQPAYVLSKRLLSTSSSSSSKPEAFSENKLTISMQEGR